MTWEVWNSQNQDFDELFQNVLVILIPAAYLVVAAIFLRLLLGSSWKSPDRQTEWTLGELGAVTRVSKESWATWRQTSSVIFSILSLLGFMGTLLLVQMDSALETVAAYRWRSFGALMLFVNGCAVMAFFKSRVRSILPIVTRAAFPSFLLRQRLSPRIGARRDVSLKTLRVFWLLVAAVCAKRLHTAIIACMREGLSGGSQSWSVIWDITWIGEASILQLSALGCFVAFCISREHREDILSELQQAFLSDANIPPHEKGNDQAVIKALNHVTVLEPRRESPETGAGLWKTISFSWIDRLIRLGNKRDYQYSDFFNLPPNDQPPILHARFKKLWEDRVKEKPMTRWTLANVLYRFSLPSTNFSALYKFVYDTLTMLGPVFLNLLVEFMTARSRGDPAASKTRGLIYVGLMAMNNFAQTVFLHQYFHKQYNLGLQFRSALSMAIFEKTLVVDRISAAAADKESDFSSGKVVNLLSVDTQRVADLMAYVHIFWSAPYQIIITGLLLWQVLGLASIAGIAVMILAIPLTKWVVGKMRKVQMIMMADKDHRLKKTNETLNGIRAVKFYAWEDARICEINNARASELLKLWRIQLINIGNRALMLGIPVVVAVGSFFIFTVIMKKQLTPAIAFTSLALFTNLRFPLQVLPNIILSLSEASVTVERIQKYLMLPELPRAEFNSPVANEPLVIVSGLCLRHDGVSPLVESLTYSVRPGEILAVVGRTGCGKSALVASMLGDFEPHKGSIEIRGTAAYCGQTAWIQTGTVQENIIGSLPMNEKRYNHVLDVCALEDDLAILADGDQTEIGERGINLSGGQKQRVALARAVYRDADTYIFDDVLSAVDAHVAEHIFSRVMKGSLKNKAVVLVTHKFEILDQVNQIIFIDRGQAYKFKSVSQALKNEAFTSLSAESIKARGSEPTTPASTPSRRSLVNVSLVTPPIMKSRLSSIPSSQLDVAGSPSMLDYVDEVDVEVDDQERIALKHRKSTKLMSFVDRLPSTAQSGSLIMSKVKVRDRIALIEDERMEKGAVSGSVYSAYFKACGNGSWFLLIFILGILTVSQTLQVLSGFWLSHWSARADPDSNDKPIGSGLGIGVYGGLNLLYVVLGAVGSLALAIGSQRASQYFHDGLVERVIRAKISFFESTPVGRILTRFAKDMQSVDDIIPQTMFQYLVNLIGIISVIVVVCIIIPYMLILVAPMVGVYLYIEKLYVNVVRQFRRIESVLRAPVISNLADTIEGVSTIRSHRDQPHFRLLQLDKLQANASAVYISNASNRWLAFRLESLGTLLIVGVALLSVLTGGSFSAALGGLALSYAINCVNGLNWLVRMSGDREANVVAVERIVEYDSDEQCPQEQYTSELTDKTEPYPGEVEFKNVCLQYRPGLPYALRDVSFKVHAGQKVGVVGRTGAGKSSLLAALLRLTEIQDGDILINGISTQPMSVTEIRTKISIIPQESTLFTGSLRLNIDPMGTSTDDQLWRSLERACLSEFVLGLTDGLDHQISEGGQNLSAGQRQLLCLARVLLKNSRILLLDEATSAVDPQTDSLIQKTIRSEFTECTIITIAHRLRTVMDYDKIMVMADGKVAEFASPAELLSNPGSIFSSLCKASGDTT